MNNYAYLKYVTRKIQLLFEISGSILLEGGGERDGRDDGHGVPLLRVLAHVDGLGGEVGVVVAESFHC